MEPGVRIAFELTHKQGAALITKHPTYPEGAERARAFKRYIKKHYDSWVAFALEHDHDEDIKPVLVDGVHLTQEFAMVAYSDNQTSIRCEFSAEVPAVASTSASVWGSWDIQGPAHTNCGPDPLTTRGNRCLNEGPALESVIPEECNQCVFISYYTIRKRIGFPRIIKAGAGPHRLPEGNFESDNIGEVVVVGTSDSDSEVDYPETGSSPRDVIHNIPLVGSKRRPHLSPLTNSTKDDRDGFDVVAEFIFQVRTSFNAWLMFSDASTEIQRDISVATPS